jgi:hypothetical protein
MKKQYLNTRSLPDLEKCLSMYALAASAAGVSMLALAQPAEGKIIYTKANKSFGPNQTLHLDLNHDGVTDFDLKNVERTFTTGAITEVLSALPDHKEDAVWGHTVPFHAYASALSANVKIGPRGQFLSAKGMMAASSVSGEVRIDNRERRDGNYSCTGPWANVSNRFLGLKFAIKGEEHFGWARLNVSCANTTINATLTGYAYESIANRPILTGQEHGTYSAADAAEPSLGRLAQGVKGQGIASGK